MNLDDFAQFPTIDKSNMLSELFDLPRQMEIGWRDALLQTESLPSFEDIQSVLICGMGGSAIAGDFFSSYAQAFCPIPIQVSREYDLPAWVNPKHTLVIASSHSGGTEETLSAVTQALKKGIRVIGITTGGRLSEILTDHNQNVLHFSHSGQPRSAVGYSFTYLAAIFYRLGLIPNPATDIEKAVSAMRSQLIHIAPEVAVAANPAKRLAGQLMGRSVVIFGENILSPIARRWKGQINELAKAWACYDFVPEACHNSIAGTQYPDRPICDTFALFLRSKLDHQRNFRRSELFQNLMMVQGFMTDALNVRGNSPIEVMWTGLSFGDFTAYYLAMGYEVDPTPIDAIQGFKKDLGDFSDF